VARLEQFDPSAEGGSHRPSGPVWCRRTSRQFQRCSFFRRRITLCHKKLSGEQY